MATESEPDELLLAQFKELFTPERHQRLDAETVRLIRLLQERAYLLGAQLATKARDSDAKTLPLKRPKNK